MYKMLRISFVLLITVVFTACGGGGGGDSKSPSEENETKTTKGVFYDDLVVGLDYKTTGFSAKTNDKGEFDYKEGKVEFYLSKLKIGEISKMTPDKKVFLSDILNKPRGTYLDPEVVKLARILQSLDTTPKSDGKIVLDTNKTKTLFAKDQNLSSVTIALLGSNITVSEANATKEVKATYIEHGITPIEKSTTTKPVANAGADANIPINIKITLDGSASTGNIKEYEWLDGGTSLQKGTNPKYTTSFSTLGDKILTLKVTDDKNATSTDDITINVNNNLVGEIIKPKKGEQSFPVNGAIEIKFNKDMEKFSFGNPFGGAYVTLTPAVYMGVSYHYFVSSRTLILGMGSNLSSDTNYTFSIDKDKFVSTDGYYYNLSGLTFKTAASIATITPAKGTKDFPIDKNITIKFSKDMDASTLIKSNILIREYINAGVQPDFNATYNATNHTLTLDPINDLEKNTTYLIKTSNDKIKTSSGDFYNMDGNHTFTTAK